MDTTVPDIVFDQRGECNYCALHDALERRYPLTQEGKAELERTVEKIKRAGIGKRYDCIAGVSGGTDSTYTLYLLKQWGLRPLAVHFDNGWDTEIAVTNVKRATDKLDIDLYTYVMDWEEFKDLQIAFLRASTPDAEIPTDIGIYGTLYKVAVQEKVKYVVNGHSFRTEGTSPLLWTYMDGKYIKSVHRRFGRMKKLKVFPNLTMSSLFYHAVLKRIHEFRPLEYVRYDKEEAGKLLEKELGWSYYGGHHHEVIYTKFHHSYLLPRKFGIDYRKVSLSARVRSGLITRDNAIEYLQQNPFQPEKELIKYVMSKLSLSEDEFKAIMASQPKSFLEYPTYYPIMKSLMIPIRLATRLNLVPEILYLKYSTTRDVKRPIKYHGADNANNNRLWDG